MGLDYVETKGRLVAAIADVRLQALVDLLPKKRLASYSVLLTQLANGSRVSESFDAVKSWGTDFGREQQVRVRKLGKRVGCLECGLTFSVRSKTNSPAMHTMESGHSAFENIENLEKRLMVIPSECLDSDAPLVAEAFARGLSIGSVKVFALRHLHFNTHALRYSKITALSNEGQPAQVVSKITHHKNLNFIVDYTSQKAADEVLRRSVEA